MRQSALPSVRPDQPSDPLAKPPIVIAIFAALSVAMTYPLALRFSTSLPAGAGDLWQNYWNFWWWKRAIFELGQSPYHTGDLFFPGGTDLIFYTHSSFNQIIAMPLNLLLGPAAAYNFCVLLALTLSGYGAHRLVVELTGNVRAGVLAGIVFAYFPQHMEQTLEHLNLFSVQFIPWSLAYLIRLCRVGGRRNVIRLGVCFALNALCSWHLGLKLILVMAPLAVVLMLRRQRPAKATLRDLSLAGALATVLIAPFVGPLMIEMATGAEYFHKPEVPRGIDPTYILTPQFSHPIFGPLVLGRYLDRAYQAAGFICYLGVAPLGLALVAAVRRRKRSALWVVIGLGAFILALGLNPFWDGDLVEGVTLPFGLLNPIPLFGEMNVANRFLILTSLALAVLAGMGWSSLRKPSSPLFLGLASVILFEYLWLPYPVQDVKFSSGYERLRVDASRGAVLDIPFHQRNRTVHNMAAQTVHGRPIGGGYLTTYPPEPDELIASEAALADLAGVPKLERPVDLDRIRELGFAWVVLHKYREASYGDRAVAGARASALLERKLALRLGGVPDETMASIREQLEERCGEAWFEDDLIAIFRL